MPRRFLFAAAVTVAFVVGQSTATEEASLVTLSSSWQEGRPIPSDILVFRDSEGCLALTTDTVVVFAEITNYALLQEVILSPCDHRIFDCAVVRALYLVGPNRFFGDLQKRYSIQPELLSQRRHQKLKTLSTERHAVVDAVFIDDKDMKPAEADAVFSQIANELRRGAAFVIVQQRYYDAHHYSYTETLSDGAKVDLIRTRVGNFSDFVISDQRRDARPFQNIELPGEHARRLLAARKGDVIVLRDEAEHRSILYQVREMYSPP